MRTTKHIILEQVLRVTKYTEFEDRLVLIVNHYRSTADQIRPIWFCSSGPI